MLRWQTQTPLRTREELYPNNPEIGWMVNEWIIHSIMGVLIYFNMRTASCRIFQKSSVIENWMDNLPEETVYYIASAKKVYAYDPSTDRCVYIDCWNSTFNADRLKQFQYDGNCYTFAYQPELTDGRLHQLNHSSDLKWHPVETYGLIASDRLNCAAPLVIGSNVYFSFGRHYSNAKIVKLDMKSLQWTIVGILNKAEIFWLNFLGQQGDLMYVTTSANKYYSINLLNGVCQELLIHGHTFLNLFIPPCISIGKFFVFPIMLVYKEGSKYRLKFVQETLNTSTSLKDLAIEAALRNNIKLDVLPPCIQKEIHLVFDPSRNLEVDLPD